MTESEPTSRHLTLDLSFLEHTIHLTHLHLPSLLLLSHFRSALNRNTHPTPYVGQVLPPTPVQPLSLTTRDNGSSRPMRALLQNDQIRHNPYSLELQHVPLRAPLVHLRMPTLQVEDVQAVHVQGLSGGWPTRADDFGPLWCAVTICVLRRRPAGVPHPQVHAVGSPRSLSHFVA